MISDMRKKIWKYELDKLRKENSLLTIKIKKQKGFLLRYESEENFYLEIKRKIESKY